METLLGKGYAGMADLGEAEFKVLFDPLRDAAAELEATIGDESITFVAVPGRSLAPLDPAAAAIERRGETSTSMFDPGELERFDPIESVDVPDAPAYLIAGVEPVGDTVGLSPEDALARITAAGRSPLTLEEGIALATQFPEAIARNACFQMPGSRCGDRRISSIWLSREIPKLGWCYAGAPHTWLGSASCAARIAA